jgi:outer membrane protein OmpA-like peptidoglycan-associated protein
LHDDKPVADVFAHPNSPAGRHSVWRWSGVPHPNSPAGRNFNWKSLGLPHPNSPAGRPFDWSSSASPFGDSRHAHHASRPAHGTHGQSQPASQLPDGLKKHSDEAQGLSRSYIVYDKGTRLQIDDREGLVAQVFFATDQSNLDPSDRNTLLQVYNYYAKLLAGPTLRRERPRVHFRLVGYADYRGGETHNLNLSSKRAATVAEYFSPLRSSPNFSQGIVAMGEGEHPQTVTPGGGLVSAQLNHYRRVDVLARPVLTKAPDPPPVVVAPPAGSRRWAIRLIDNAGLSIGLAGAYVARLEILDRTNQMAMTFRYKALGGSKGAKVSASVGGTHDSWQYVTTSEPLTFDDFVGHADHVGESVAFGYGYSVDRFILHGPLHKGGSVCVKFASWGYAVSFGIDIEGNGSLSKGVGPYPTTPEYMAKPPAGPDIRW